MLLPTLRSRCRHERFSRLDGDAAGRVLEDLARRMTRADGQAGSGGVGAGRADLAAAFAFADGSPGLALEILRADVIKVLTRIDAFLDPAKPPAAGEAQRIAADLSGRNTHRAAALALEHLRRRLQTRVTAGADPRLAVRVARLWEELAVRGHEIELFNVDRQTFLMRILDEARACAVH